MLSLAGRFALFLLLVLDWSADPTLLAPGLEPLATAWHSTENVCPSALYRQTVLRHSSPDLRPARANRPSAVRSRRATGTAAVPAPAHTPVRTVYVFMSLRR